MLHDYLTNELSDFVNHNVSIMGHSPAKFGGRNLLPRTYVLNHPIKSNYFLVVTLPLPIFPSCLNLILHWAIDLLDFIEVSSWFHISVPRICIEFVPWVISLAGGTKNNVLFLRLYRGFFFWEGLHKSGVSGYSTFVKSRQ